MAKAKCAYEECMLPQNNKHFLWQICYMFIGLCVLFFRAEDFTFFQTFLFIAPIVLDILNTNFYSNILNWIRRGFGILDAALLIGCLLGMFGILEDTGSGFAVSQSFLYFSGGEIKKTTVGIIIAFNLIIPIIFYIGSPCQEATRMLSKLKTIKQEGAKQG